MSNSILYSNGHIVSPYSSYVYGIGHNISDNLAKASQNSILLIYKCLELFNSSIYVIIAKL